MPIWTVSRFLDWFGFPSSFYQFGRMHCGCLDEKEKENTPKHTNAHTHTHAVAHTLQIERVKRNKFSRSLLRAAGMSDSRFIRWIWFDRILWINRFTFTMTHFFRVAFKFQNEFHFGEEFFFEWHLYRRNTTPLYRKSTEQKQNTRRKSLNESENGMCGIS